MCEVVQVQLHVHGLGPNNGIGHDVLTDSLISFPRKSSNNKTLHSAQKKKFIMKMETSNTKEKKITEIKCGTVNIFKKLCGRTVGVN